MSTMRAIDDNMRAGQEAYDSLHSEELKDGFIGKERIIKINCLESISPGMSNSDEDLLSNCSTESAGSSAITSRKKNVVFSNRGGCPQCSRFANVGCPKCSPSSRGNLQNRLQQSPAIGVARNFESTINQPEDSKSVSIKSAQKSKVLVERLKFLKDTRTYRPELWEVARSVRTFPALFFASQTMHFSELTRRLAPGHPVRGGDWRGRRGRHPPCRVEGHHRGRQDAQIRSGQVRCGPSAGACCVRRVRGASSAGRGTPHVVARRQQIPASARDGPAREQSAL